jgi:hypothetical protein
MRLEDEVMEAENVPAHLRRDCSDCARCQCPEGAHELVEVKFLGLPVLARGACSGCRCPALEAVA